MLLLNLDHRWVRVCVESVAAQECVLSLRIHTTSSISMMISSKLSACDAQCWQTSLLQKSIQFSEIWRGGGYQLENPYTWQTYWYIVILEIHHAAVLVSLWVCCQSGSIWGDTMVLACPCSAPMTGGWFGPYPRYIILHTGRVPKNWLDFGDLFFWICISIKGLNNTCSTRKGGSL